MKRKNIFLLSCVSLLWIELAVAESTQKFGDIKGGENAILNAPENVTINYGSKEAIDNTADEWKFIDRYQVKGGLAKDPTTGLMWMRCSIGQTWDGSNCQGEVVKVTWEQAMTIPKNLDYAGYSDWRLPTIQELHDLVYCSDEKKIVDREHGHWFCNGDYSRPTIVQGAFPNTPIVGWFWSSSSSNLDSSYACNVFFSSGYNGEISKNVKNTSNVKNFGGAVRLVRGGQ